MSPLRLHRKQAVSVGPARLPADGQGSIGGLQNQDENRDDQISQARTFQSSPGNEEKGDEDTQVGNSQGSQETSPEGSWPSKAEAQEGDEKRNQGY